MTKLTEPLAPLQVATFLSLEEKETAKVEALRNRKEQRKNKFLDDKARLIGCDKDGLDAQIAEKREIEAQRRADARRQDTEIVEADKMLCFMKIEEQKKHREYAMAVRQLNEEISKAKAAPEKDTVPPRVGDDDPRCGPASLQQFNGEDLIANERKKRQQEQFASILESQIFEKRSFDEQKRQEEAARAEQMSQIYALRTEVEEREHQLRENIESIRDTANKNAAEVKKQAQETLHGKDSELNARHFETVMNDPLVNEFDKGLRVDGKPRRDEFKGHTRGAWQETQDFQHQQVEENLRRLRSQKNKELQVDAHLDNCRKKIVHQKIDAQQAKREHARRVAEENLRLAEFQKTKNAERERFYKTGDVGGKQGISEEFYTQFGQSDR